MSADNIKAAIKRDQLNPCFIYFVITINILILTFFLAKTVHALTELYRF